jgi:cytochrome c
MPPELEHGVQTDMPRTLVILALAALVVSACPGLASEFGTRDEAVAMVKRVQEKFKKEGPEATFKAVTDQSTKEFHDRDLYPFVYDLNGINVAHGARPALVGKDLISLKDQSGKYLIKEMIAIAKGSGSAWIDYKWPHPITSKIEDKSSYIERMGDYFVGVGVYRF